MPRRLSLRCDSRAAPASQADHIIDGMELTELKPWRDGWAEQLSGRPCVLCDLAGVRENAWGVRVFAGRYVDAYLPRSGSVPGYTVAVWNGRHVSEPTELKDQEAAGYWLETLRVGRAVEQSLEHAKMNYQMLGNNVPHLHAHIVPRPLLDPAPNRPLPWSFLDQGRQDDMTLAAVAERVRSALT
jgi:diadenosine tetraphosphate (Ap4A) HIT family hydrolase